MGRGKPLGAALGEPLFSSLLGSAIPSTAPAARERCAEAKSGALALVAECLEQLC